MDKRIALAAALALAGCPAKQGIRDAAEDLAQTIGEGIERLVDEHPTETRALLGLECDATQTCGAAGEFEGQACRLTQPDWKPGFHAKFLDCLEACGDLDACYAEAVQAQPPSVDQGAHERCRQRIATCQIVTDACDAFEISSDVRLLQQVDACSERACADLEDCQSDALLELPSDAQ